MLDFSSSTAYFALAGFFILALLFTVLFALYRYFNSRPSWGCASCEWEGEESQIDIYAVETEEGQQSSWFYFCPECGSSKIVNLKPKVEKV